MVINDRTVGGSQLVWNISELMIDQGILVKLFRIWQPTFLVGGPQGLTSHSLLVG